MEETVVQETSPTLPTAGYGRVSNSSGFKVLPSRQSFPMGSGCMCKPCHICGLLKHKQRKNFQKGSKSPPPF